MSAVLNRHRLLRQRQLLSVLSRRSFSTSSTESVGQEEKKAETDETKKEAGSILDISNAASHCKNQVK